MFPSTCACAKRCQERRGPEYLPKRSDGREIKGSESHRGHPRVQPKDRDLHRGPGVADPGPVFSRLLVRRSVFFQGKYQYEQSSNSRRVGSLHSRHGSQTVFYMSMMVPTTTTSHKTRPQNTIDGDTSRLLQHTWAANLGIDRIV